MLTQKCIPTHGIPTDKRGNDGMSVAQSADKFVSGETQEEVEKALEWVSRLVDAVLDSKGLPQDFLTPKEKRNMARFAPVGRGYLLISVPGTLKNTEEYIREKMNSLTSS